jgi:hypothetical protein
MNIINGIELYDLTESVINKYRTEAKKNKNLDIKVLRRKLTAIVLNAWVKKFESANDVKYKFGGCYLHVDEKHKLIIDIGWYDEKHSSYNISKFTYNKLIQTNLKLGLNKSGTIII